MYDAPVVRHLLDVVVAVSLALGLAAPRLAQADDEAPELPTAALDMQYRLERVKVDGNRWTSSAVIRARVPFRRGQVLDMDDPQIEDTRVRLLATGYFADVQLVLERGTRRGWVVLVVRVRERGTLRLQDVSLGVGQAGGYGGLDVADANFLGLGRSAGGAFVIAGDQQAFRLRLLDPAILRGTVLSAAAFYAHARDYFGAPEVMSSSCPDPDAPCDFADVRYDRGGLDVALGGEIAPNLNLHLRERIEVIHVHGRPVTLATRRDGVVRAIDIDLHPGTSVLSTLSLGIEHDTRSDPYLPRTGTRVWSEAEVSSIGTASDYSYARLTAGLESYHRLPWRHVLEVELFGGLVFGDAPFFEQFYIGDISDLAPPRVLDLAPSARGSPNFLGTVIGEMRYQNVAAKVALEYAVPLLRRQAVVYGADFFAGVGMVLLGDLEDLTLARPGTSGFARAPVDLTFDVGFRIDTEAGVFVLSVSNLAGLIPLRGHEP